MRMDQIAQEIAIHYLRATGRVIHAISEEVKEIISSIRRGDGTSSTLIPSTVPPMWPWASGGISLRIAKRNLAGPEDFHLRSGQEYIAAGMLSSPQGLSPSP